MIVLKTTPSHLTVGASHDRSAHARYLAERSGNAVQRSRALVLSTQHLLESSAERFVTTKRAGAAGR